jgi:predicted transcriptional regulator
VKRRILKLLQHRSWQARIGLAGVIGSNKSLLGIVTTEDMIKRLMQIGRF